MRSRYMNEGFVPPESKKTTGQIRFISELTGTNTDLDEFVHKGFTIGKGKKMYWMMIFHSTGYGVSVFSLEQTRIQSKRRWITGDTEITVHFL